MAGCVPAAAAVTAICFALLIWLVHRFFTPLLLRMGEHHHGWGGGNLAVCNSMIVSIILLFTTRHRSERKAAKQRIDPAIKLNL
jgi:sugar phosphate permease